MKAAWIFSAAILASFLQNANAAALKNPSLEILNARAVSSHKVRFEIPATKDFVPSNCRVGALLYITGGNPPASFFSPFLKIDGMGTVEVDGLEAGVQYGFGTEIYTVCTANNSSRTLKTTVSPILATVQTPIENVNAPKIVVGDITPYQTISSMYPKALVVDIQSDGTHHAVTSIDGRTCVASHAINDCSAVITNESTPYSMGGSINNQDVSGAWVSAYALPASGSRRLRLDIGLAADMDPSVPHVFKIEFIDFLGRSSSREYTIPANFL